MPTAVENYLEKYKAFQVAKGSLNKVTDAILHVAAQIMAHREKCYVKGLDPIPRILQEKGTELDFTNWSTKNRFNALVVAYYDALGKTLQAWEALNFEERNGLQPPPQVD